MKPIILYEDNHIIVCRKLHGIATQSRRPSEPDMVSLLKNHLNDNQSEKGEPYLAVIHRLDQPVEGILVFAKTPFAAKELNKQLQSGSFGKHYKALLCGTPPKASGILIDYLVRDGRSNCSRVCLNEPDGKKAVLNYRLLTDFFSMSADIAAVEILLETGRHHQIRVQMAHLGCPIMGDTKYNTVPYPTGQRCPLALCAYRLEFLHPKTKKQMSYKMTPAFYSV